MRRLAQTTLLTLTGFGLLHTALFTDLYLRYVKEGLRPLLIASGAVMVLLGVANILLDRRRTPDGTPAPDRPDHLGHLGYQGGHDHGHDHAHDHGHDDAHAHGHGHDHSAAPRVAWLLVLPALSLLLYAPPALGAYTAAHSNDKAVVKQSRFDPLPATSTLPMTLTAFTTRVQQDPTRAIRGRTVQLTGFVTPIAHDGGWYLTRIIFTCCAADSQSVKVRVYGTPAPPADTWLAVSGTWHPKGALGSRTAEAALDVRETHGIPQPVNAFTDDLPLTPSS
ncbi:TIGR03943 family protein [Streptomyces sp. NBC_00820]|uniref:TIGR03943 family putative permease subunit n=1 Tax=Streptomyces sp. NBC_00820 TaxID=2975842 RepID=UPI002ED2486B|nr:TIGR03943 family protein [Streptomyces sp. NBC_00820]